MCRTIREASVDGGRRSRSGDGMRFLIETAQALGSRCARGAATPADCAVLEGVLKVHWFDPALKIMYTMCKYVILFVPAPISL
jgi:hypothetical protein